MNYIAKTFYLIIMFKSEPSTNDTSVITGKLDATNIIQ